MHKLFLSLHDLFDVRQLDFSKAADTKQHQMHTQIILYKSLELSLFLTVLCMTGCLGGFSDFYVN